MLISMGIPGNTTVGGTLVPPWYAASMEITGIGVTRQVWGLVAPSLSLRAPSPVLHHGGTHATPHSTDTTIVTEKLTQYRQLASYAQLCTCERERRWPMADSASGGGM